MGGEQVRQEEKFCDLACSVAGVSNGDIAHLRDS